MTFNTTSNGGTYAPANIVAGWIEVDQGPFVKTVAVDASLIRKVNLVAWNLVDPTYADAISGATILDHVQPVTMTWNLRDRNNQLVPDGKYRIRLEMADSDARTTADNRQGAFLFTVSANPQMQTGLTNNGFTNATVDFKPVLCSNGVVDPGETCDSAIPGSCPTACAPSGDVCAPNNLVGDAMLCTAACQVTTITNCINDDGCCAPGCTVDTDNDCAGLDQNSVGGCETNGGGGIALAALGLGLLVARRRRY